MKQGFSSWIIEIGKSAIFWLTAAVAFLSAILPSFFGADFITPVWTYPCILLIGTISAAYQIHARDMKTTSSERIIEYDVFLASPMAAFETEEEYEASRREIQDLITWLKIYCRLPRTFYAGTDIKSKKKFDPADMAFKDNFSILKKTKFFVMVYPKHLPSSVLVEVGYALALDLPIIILVKTNCKLPYLLQNIPQINKKTRVYEYHNSESLENILKIHGKEIVRLLENDNN